MADRPSARENAEERARRSAEALRANLKRRKAQERSRAETGDESAPDPAGETHK